MMRRLSVLTFLVVGVVMLMPTPLASSERYAGEGCRNIDACTIECCDSRGICIEFRETGCPGAVTQ
jgi:hypothetical protein